MKINSSYRLKAAALEDVQKEFAKKQYVAPPRGTISEKEALVKKGDFKKEALDLAKRLGHTDAEKYSSTVTWHRNPQTRVEINVEFVKKGSLAGYTVVMFA